MCGFVGASVHTLKHEYLRNQQAELNQILSEALFGSVLIALGFGPGRFGTLADFHP